mgnify:CR=1 FL=1
MTHRPANPHTIAARTGVDTDTAHGAVMPPLYLSSNYSFAAFGQPRKYDYSRSGNPTRDTLADALAGLEGGSGAAVAPTAHSSAAASARAAWERPDPGGPVTSQACEGCSSRAARAS